MPSHVANINEVEQRIIRDWQAGKFGNDPERVVLQLMAELNLSRTEAQTHYERLRPQLAGLTSPIVRDSGSTVNTAALGAPNLTAGRTTTPITTPPTATPALPPPPPGGGGNTDPLQDFGRYSSYLSSLGLSPSGGGAGATSQRNLFDPFNSLFTLQNQFSGLTGQDQGGFADYIIRNAPGGFSGIQSGALDLLRRLQGAGFSARQERGLSFTPEFDEFGVRTSGANNTAEVSQNSQRGLLELALSGQFGRAGTAQITNRLPTERRLFSAGQSQGQGQGGPDNFLDFLLQKYNVRF